MLQTLQLVQPLMITPPEGVKAVKGLGTGHSTQNPAPVLEPHATGSRGTFKDSI